MATFQGGRSCSSYISKKPSWGEKRIGTKPKNTGKFGEESTFATRESGEKKEGGESSAGNCGPNRLKKRRVRSRCGSLEKPAIIGGGGAKKVS